MRRIIPIFLASLLLLNSVGLIIFNLGEMEARKAEMVSYITSCKDFSKLSLISFSSSDNFSLLNESEILSNGQLFDIVRSENTNGNIIYYAISDDKEDAFWSSVSDLAKSNADAHQVPGKNIMPDILKFFSEDKLSGFPASFSFRNCSELNFNSNVFIYKSPFGDIFSPPPQSIIS